MASPCNAASTSPTRSTTRPIAPTLSPSTQRIWREACDAALPPRCADRSTAVPTVGRARLRSPDPCSCARTRILGALARGSRDSEPRPSQPGSACLRVRFDRRRAVARRGRPSSPSHRARRSKSGPPRIRCSFDASSWALRTSLPKPTFVSSTRRSRDVPQLRRADASVPRARCRATAMSAPAKSR